MSAVSRDSLRNKRRVVRLVTIVTAMFALSWLPIQVLMVKVMVTVIVTLALFQLILLLKSLDLYPVTITNISLQVQKQHIKLILIDHLGDSP